MTRHEPVEHVSVPLARLHVTLQAPQSVSVRRLRSHPVESIASQSPKPAVHDWIRQLPPPQVGVAFARLHVEVQLPQVPTCSSDVSQPLESTPSQSSRSASHDPIWQVEATHTAVAPARVQTLPQAPQWEAVVRRSVSQPLTGVKSQLSKLGSHTQRPPMHVELGPHTLPQTPQFRLSVWRSTQPAAPQQVLLALVGSQAPPSAVQVQVPPTHASALSSQASPQ